MIERTGPLLTVGLDFYQTKSERDSLSIRGMVLKGEGDGSTRPGRGEGSSMADIAWGNMIMGTIFIAWDGVCC